MINRRTALQRLGLGLGALAFGCGPAETCPGPGEAEGGGPGTGLLQGIDAFVVLMMENRSFDHFLGALRTDAAYPGRGRIDGLRGDEENPDPAGHPVRVFRAPGPETASPPHEWDSCHAQFDGGRNDGFVRAYAGPRQAEAMGYHDRAQLPFLYALADRYTVCDRWFSSVLGPTWPNRFYLHATTSCGKKDISPFLVGGPDTIWDRMRERGLVAKNYSAGQLAFFTAAFAGEVLEGRSPVVPIDDFFRDAAAGTLPAFSLIDPDFQRNDDHPPHDISLGEAFIASVFRALAQSPQWPRCLLVITYDEHGGFYDHVPPPPWPDDDPDFAQLGFRVPTVVAGPTVRRGFVNSQQFDHVSVAATLRTRHGLRSLSRRMDRTADISSCIDPMLAGHPAPPPPLDELPL